ncbi:MAG: pantoate--beta-alanine ligase [Omnitrophica WOR_2 bacterium SM23_72]|nr:MAG: pantoate--beta-alanine ligase [Omnitrophica WOR_2 bacterium SM23_72]
MRIIRNIKEMTRAAQKRRLQGDSIGFVPTMGALHAGHLSLIRRCRRENDFTVVSIFVNPTQFSPREDYRKYPRNLIQDARACQEEGVDIIFFPDAKDMYPKPFRTFVEVEGLSELLCGHFRPGHFRGVTTVVAKLFQIVQPDIAYFGQKDAQQAIIIRKMVEDLSMPVQIKVMPIVRERDGLALSSRNQYLNASERKDAVVLHQALNLAKDSLRRRETDASRVIQSMRTLIQKKKSARVDYISIVDLQNLKPLKKIRGKALVALAVWIGKTRLIDNAIVKLRYA